MNLKTYTIYDLSTCNLLTAVARKNGVSQPSYSHTNKFRKSHCQLLVHDPSHIGHLANSHRIYCYDM